MGAQELQQREADEQAKKKERRETEAMYRKQGLVPVEVKASVGVFVSSGPQKKGLNLAELQSKLSTANKALAAATEKYVDARKEHTEAESELKAEVARHLETDAPTAAPSLAPTPPPSAAPTKAPTTGPPTAPPTEAPTAPPTEPPTAPQTDAPTDAPTTSDAPTDSPTEAPTDAPTSGATDAPTAAPTNATQAVEPEFLDLIELDRRLGRELLQLAANQTTAPTEAPTDAPTDAPTGAPTPPPSDAPTSSPSETPTKAPTKAPTAPTMAPIHPTSAPTGGPTDAPSNAPTAVPTSDPAVAAKEKKDKQTVKEAEAALRKAKSENVLEKRKTAALGHERAQKTKREEEREKRRLAEKEAKVKADLKARIAKKYNSMINEKKIQDAKQQAVTAIQQEVNEVAALPANTAYGKLPEMQAKEGELRVRNSPALEEDSFLKFPCGQLDEKDTIVQGGAALMLYKFDKSTASPITVSASSCAWDRATLTYTKEIKMPTNVVSADGSQFIDTSSIADGSDDRWFDVKLDGSAIQKLRLAGDTLCFKISGGPAEESVVLGSEMSKQRPILKLLLKKAPQTNEAEQGEGTERSEEMEKAKAAFKQKKTEELTKQFSEEALAENKKLLKNLDHTAAKACESEITAKTTGKAMNAIKGEIDMKALSVLEKKVAAFAENEKDPAKVKDAREKMEAKIREESAIKLQDALTAKKQEIQRRCDDAKQDRATQYGNMSADQEAKVGQKVMAALPAAMEAFLKNSATAAPQESYLDLVELLDIGV